VKAWKNEVKVWKNEVKVWKNEVKAWNRCGCILKFLYLLQILSLQQQSFIQCLAYFSS